MLDVRVNNESLDLLPGAQIELEQNNPYLVFDNSIPGEFSLPLEVPATPKNLRLTNYSAVVQKVVDTKGIDVTVFDGGFQHSRGKLKVEKVAHNLNRGQSSRLSFFYLTGVSDFFQEIKNIRLRDVDLGGDRVFAWAGDLLSFQISGNGFWPHITAVINAAPNSYDYAFYPVINHDFGSKGDNKLINRCFWHQDGQVRFRQLSTDQKDINPIVPMPYLHYVLRKAIEHVGWTIQGEILDDTAFRKITMENTSAIDWGNVAALAGYGYPQVQFNLKDSVPDDSISDFLLALKNHFGWWYDFDRNHKIITIKAFSRSLTGDTKDMTRNAEPVMTKTVLSEKKLYALKNSSDGGTINLDNYVGDVHDYTFLPAPTILLNAKVYLVILENTYYECAADDSGNNYTWQVYSSNTKDVVPVGATDDITTTVSTPGMEQYDAYTPLLPRDDSGGRIGPYDELTWNVKLLFYHGLVNNLIGQPYPYASSHVYDCGANQLVPWALSWKCKLFNGTEVGLYDLNFKSALEKLQTTEELDIILHLSRSEFLSLKWTDIIVISGVKLYIKTIKPTLPFKGALSLTCTRIIS